MKKNKLIIISGPTGVGKTSLSIKLAKKLNTEIISADSMQIYKNMNIGTAKITPQETQGVIHHMIDIIRPDESYSVEMYRREVFKILENIWSKNKIPIICGGTPMYIQSILYNLNFSEHSTNSAVKNKIEEERKKDNLWDFNILNYIDPEMFNKISRNDHKRIARAIEYFICTNTKYSSKEYNFLNKNTEFDWTLYFLNMNRSSLYQIIDKRVDKMVEEPLIDEVNHLLQLYNTEDNLQSLQAIGYKELIQYLNNEIDLNSAINLIKKRSRNYAKRQMTWFRRDKNAFLVPVDLFSQEIILDTIINNLNLEEACTI